VSLDRFGRLGIQTRARDHPVGKVGPVEDADQDFGVAELELLDDVFADTLR
jgi:hypothetical protein